MTSFRRVGGYLAVGAVLLLYFPLFLLFFREGVWSDMNIGKYAGILGRTAIQAGLSTICALILGIPGAFFLARTKIRGRFILRGFSLLPFVLPPLLVLWGFILMWGNNGLINRWLPAERITFLYSLPAIIAVHGFYNFGIYMRLIAVVWERMNGEEEDAARLLGSSSFRVWWTVTLPRLLPAIRSATTLVFIFCFTSFSVVMVIGGGVMNTTLETALYHLLRTQPLEGAQVAFLQSVFLLGISLIFTSGKTIPASSTLYVRHYEGMAVRVGGAVYLVIVTLLCLVPLFLVGLTAIFPPAHLRGAVSSWEGLGYPLRNSMFFAVIAGVGAVLLGAGLALLVHRRGSARVLGILVLVPLSISPFTLSLAYLRLFGTHSIFVVFIHVLLSLPLVVYVLHAVLDTTKIAWKEGAISLGASPFQVLVTIVLPLIMPGILIAFFLSMAISLGELNAALIFTAPSRPTIPVMMYQLFSQYRILASIRAGFLLLVLALIIYFIIEKWGKWAIRHL